MRTGCLELCVKRAFPFRDEFNRLGGRASSFFNITEKFQGCGTISLNSDNFPAEVIGERVASDGCGPSCLKGYDGFLVMQDRLEMHGVAVTGKLSSRGGRAKKQNKDIGHICSISPMLLHKESIS